MGDARDLVQQFFHEQRHPDGGFQDRAGQRDIYYTVFGLEGLIALQAEAADLPLDATVAYLQTLGAGEALDFVHLACLARAWATVGHRERAAPSLPQPPSPPSGVRRDVMPNGGEGGARGTPPSPRERPHESSAPVDAMSEGGAAAHVGERADEPRRATLSDVVREAMAARIEMYRSADGGYQRTPGAARGSVYAAFLALGAYQDLQRPLPRPERLLASIATLRTPDGGYSNHPDTSAGLTTATAAAVGLYRQLGTPLPDAAAIAAWLLARHHPQGGFIASPATPMPDLLSTATALHALATLQAPLTAIQEPTLDFLDTLWTNRGGFYGHWADDHVDCEYTYYGLLALGHLTW